MTDYGLSAQQIAVIDALSNGVTVTEAAAEAGIHRNTVINWRRNNIAFQFAFAHAQYDRALLYRERAESLVDLAYATLEALLTDPKTPATVRLKAALYIHEKASTPPPPKSHVPIDNEKVRKSHKPSIRTSTLCIPCTILHNPHNRSRNPSAANTPKSGAMTPVPAEAA